MSPLILALELRYHRRGIECKSKQLQRDVNTIADHWLVFCAIYSYFTLSLAGFTFFQIMHQHGIYVIYFSLVTHVDCLKASSR